MIIINITTDCTYSYYYCIYQLLVLVPWRYICWREERMLLCTPWGGGGGIQNKNLKWGGGGWRKWVVQKKSNKNISIAISHYYITFVE